MNVMGIHRVLALFKILGVCKHVAGKWGQDVCNE